MKPFSVISRCIASILFVVLVGAACSAAKPTAATVNGDDITRSDFERELKALQENKEFFKALQQQGQVTGDDKKMDPAFTARWLTQLIQFELLIGEFEGRDLKVSKKNLDAANKQATQQFGGEKTWKAFPKWFRDLMSERFAKLSTLEKELTKFPITPEGAKKYFDENRKDFDEFCVKHILVKTIEEAKEISTTLAAGGDFAVLARERSQDAGSGAQGGDLGCGDANGYVKPFADAVRKLEIGKLSDPVKTEFGYHLIVVNERKPAADDTDVTQVLAQKNQQFIGEFLTKLFKNAKVKVDARYGKYSFSKETGPLVTPPEDPKPADRRDGGTPTTGVTGTPGLEPPSDPSAPTPPPPPTP